MKTVLSIVLFFLVSNLCFGEFRTEDKLRIHEAVKISKTYGDAIWKGFNEVPFSLILVTEEHEYLIYHDHPSEDFKLIAFDSLLQTNIYSRKTQYSKNFLATFPAVNGVNCIVVGTPEHTGLSSSEWIMTLLHEHFHQYVNSSPNYFEAVERLNLSKGDTTGMWMLNYAFPYDNKAIIQSYTTYCDALYNLYNSLEQTSKPSLEALKHFKTARHNFKSQLQEDDYNYFSFQLWQEGIARYTELKFLEALKDYEVSSKLKPLPDFMPFKDLKDHQTKNEVTNVKTLQLDKQQRICFYSVGCLEGLILDKLNPSWRTKYMTHKFYLEKHL